METAPQSEPEVSAPAAFARPRKRITLPDPAPDGTPLVVEIVRPQEEDALMAIGAFPTYAEPEKPKKKAGETYQQAAVASAKRIAGERAAWRRVAAVGLVAPVFAFEAPEEGKPYWGDLTDTNQEFIATQVMDMCPMFDRISRAAQEAARVGLFPDAQGRVAAGRGPVPGAQANGAFHPGVTRARRTARRARGAAGPERPGRGAAAPRG